MRTRALSFRVKLLAAMMLVVGGVTATTLYVALDRLRRAHDQLFEERFRSRVNAFDIARRARLAQVRDKCAELARSIRIGAAMEEEDWELLYRISRDELREILRPSAASGGEPPELVRFINPAGAEILPAEDVAAAFDSEELRAAFRQVASTMREGVNQRVGHVARQRDGRREILEVIVTKVVFRPTGAHLGALVLGFNAAAGTDTHRPTASGIWVDGELVFRSLRPDVAGQLMAPLTDALDAHPREGTFAVPVNGEPYRVFFERLTNADFLPAYQVACFPLTEINAEEAALRQRMIAFGALVLSAALIISLLLSRGLTDPIATLVRGTTAIQRGDYAVRLPLRHRDEIGRLTESFNEMAAGLEQKEKFQSLLNMVADKDVAEELMRGEVTLGGELREISVLFCDIRGFTAMTQDMAPTDVIALMNEHFTELTRIVHSYHGVVDKFVGDLIMAVFGAPKGRPDDANNAARCCLEMIAACERRNRTASQPIHVGIGLASGEAVAGCMGSEDRLNYTVMGARVNLASRLCSAAGVDEVVIDHQTFERVTVPITTEDLPELRVKGFDTPVRAYKLRSVQSSSGEDKAT